LIDGFGTLDIARLNALFKDDPNYTTPSQNTLTALNAIPAVLVDKNFFMIFDNMYEFTENYNGQGLYWNYFYHTWKTFSMSPFANALVFVPAVPSVTSVTVSPTAITCKKGQSVQLSVDVVTNNYAPKTVNWSSNTDGVTVDINGHVTVAASVTDKSATITATSTFDNTKSGTCTVTITD